MKPEDHLQNMVFGVVFERMPWDVSPMQAKELLEKAISNSGIGTRFRWKISLTAVALENQ